MGEVDQQSGHLSDAQIEEYANTVATARPEAGDRPEQIEAHLADCPACRDRILASQRAWLALLTVPVNTPLRADHPGPGPDCPGEDDLRNLAAGLFPLKSAANLTQHAAQCDHCGPLLRLYTEDFSDDLGADDQPVLAKLKSSSSGWQKKLADSILTGSERSSAKSERKPFPWRWVMAPTALAACAAIAFAVWYSQRETPEKVEKLLAQAYTKQRTIEMRFPSAAWGPMRVTLGPEDSRFSKPRELLQAEEIISRNQSAYPNEADWVQLKAQAELLDGPPEVAISTLTEGLRATPESTSLMMDLALAYFQQAQKSHNRQDYVKVIDFLTRIARKEPRNKEALFNLALTYTRAEMWDQAATAWEAYLQLDPDGPWANEAKGDLELAKAKLKAGQQGLPGASMKASAFLALPDAEIEFSTEEYQDIAVQYWIARAVSHPESEERRAVERLAAVMSHKHPDLWLRDFIGPPTARDPSAALSLGSAVTANIKGHYGDAIEHSSQAERSFKAQHNLPGELRARYEAVYASQRFLNGRDCLTRAGPLERTVTAASYHWLQAQVAIERAICFNFIGKLPESASEMLSSFRIAQRFHFPILALRNIGISQGLEIQRGQYEAAWDHGLDGLRDYWTGPPSVQRLYQFYVGMALSAEQREFWSAAETLQGHAVDILGKDDQIQRGAALLELSKILVADKQDDAAENKLNEANELFDRESAEPTSRTYRLIGKIGLAELQLKHGRAADALSTLAPAGNLLSKTDPYFVSLNFYRVLGNAELQLKELSHAEQSYETAIVIAEKSLDGIHNDQDRLQWVRTGGDAYRGLVRTLLEQRRQDDALRLWEWFESRPSGDAWTGGFIKDRKKGSTWPEIWAKISAVSWGSHGAARLVFAVFDDGLQIWSLGEGGLNAAWTPISREQLDERVRQFTQSCSRRDSPLADVQRQGEALFAMLVQPVIDDLPPGNLVAIELDHSLVDLPMEALHSPAGWYFAERYPVIYSPGLLSERRLRRLAPLDSSRSFLLADATAAGAYLPGQELEHATVSTHFPDTKVVGPETDLATLHSLLARSDIFGFMGHGEPNGSGTALRVGPSLLLKAEDFPPPTLHKLQLGVLAACASGSGAKSGLLDHRNLVHALLAGGVPSVVASKWDVDSEATGHLMEIFYTHTANRETPAQALSVARNECLRALGHPYFWSAFRLIGRAD